jgi:hypothetical protein
MEVTAAKMRAALELGISFSAIVGCRIVALPYWAHENRGPILVGIHVHILESKHAG